MATTSSPETVTYQVGQAVSIWLGGRLGQVEALHRTHVDVLYCAGGRLCRQRVDARDLWLHGQHEPLLFPPFNPFNRAVPLRPERKTFSLDPNRRRQAPPRPRHRHQEV